MDEQLLKQEDEFDAAFDEGDGPAGAPENSASASSDNLTGDMPAAPEGPRGHVADESGAPSADPAPEGPRESVADKPGALAADSAPDKSSGASPAADLEELTRKAHGYDSMLGRLEAERAQRKALEAQLAQMRAPAPQPAAPASVEVPESIRAEMEELRQRDPRFAALALEDSAEGRRIRKGLEEYGVEYAADRADTVLLRREVDARLNAVQESAQSVSRESAMQAFYSAVGSRHADWVALATDPARASEHERYMAGVRAWAEGLSYSEGARMFQIIDRGTPAEVSWLLDRYKEFTTAGGSAPARSGAEDARAVPSRPGQPPSARRASKDDFDAGWDEAPEK